MNLTSSLVLFHWTSKGSSYHCMAQFIIRMKVFPSFRAPPYLTFHQPLTYKISITQFMYVLLESCNIQAREQSLHALSETLQHYKFGKEFDKQYRNTT